MTHLALYRGREPFGLSLWREIHMLVTMFAPGDHGTNDEVLFLRKASYSPCMFCRQWGSVRTTQVEEGIGRLWYFDPFPISLAFFGPIFLCVVFACEFPWLLSCVRTLLKIIWRQGKVGETSKARGLVAFLLWVQGSPCKGPYNLPCWHKGACKAIPRGLAASIVAARGPRSRP